MDRRLFILFLGLSPWAAAQTVKLDPVTVSVARDSRPDSLDTQWLDVRTDPARSVPASSPADFALRAAPSFSLFRRGTSLDLNPSAQGVSLRGIGPSAASRSLVIWDGVPLNDAFGGWVNWTKVEAGTLERIELAPGGAATSWGNAALSGVISFIPRVPAPGEIAASAYAGAFGTWSLSGRAADATPAGTLTVEGARFSREGATPVKSEQRGVVDRPADIRYERASVRWSADTQTLGRWSAQVRWYNETRGNGTAGQRNGSTERFGSLRWQSPQQETLAQEATFYLQAQSYQSTFTTVSADRSRETPASEQFEVPSTAVGAAWSARTTVTGPWQFQFGADARSVQGETRERYSYSNGNYTRTRFAGGAQSFGGAFVQAAWNPQPWALTASLRHDRWRETDGHRRDTEIGTGLRLRDDMFANRSGGETSPRLAAQRTLPGGFTWVAEAYRRFRRPTLNELYRPFRQGADQTEANPQLGTERLTGVETGLAWGRGAARLRAVLFAADLEDAVANITVARGPGTYPDFGFIPAGSVGRRKMNIDRVAVEGGQLEASWSPASALDLEAAWLWSSSEIRRFAYSPTLLGRTPPQTPAHTVTAGLTWRAHPRLSLSALGRWSGSQYEDDENRVELPAAAVVDLAASLSLPAHTTLRTGVRNVAGAEVETSRTAAGIVQVGQPREAWISLEWHR